MESGGDETEKTEAAVRRPPSVPENLWSVVPDRLKKEFVETAALELRRGVHPAESFTKMLEERGIDRPAVAAPAFKKVSFRKPAAERPEAPPAAAAPERQPADRHGHPAASRGRVLPPASGNVPLGVIGAAIHKEMRLGGSPGKAAAEAEASVLAAIASDPAYALSDPCGIRCLGARVPASVAAAIAPFVEREAERVLQEVRVRAAAGDPSAVSWIDPDGWTFQHGDEEGAGPALC